MSRTGQNRRQAERQPVTTMTSPAAPSSPPVAPAALPAYRTRLGFGLVVLAMALVAWRVVTPAASHTRAVRIASELGAETFDRPLQASELDAALELHPIGTAAAKSTSLRELLAKHDTVLLHFWASWCPPCIDELPEIAALADSAEGRNCQVVAVSYDDEWAAADSTLQRTLATIAPPSGSWLRDPQGQSGQADKMLRLQFGSEKLPETWVVSDGKVRARFVAGQKWTSAKMRRWLAAQCPTTR